MRKTVAAAAMAGSLLAGGALGMALFGPTSAIGQTTSTTTPSNGDNAGTFRSNEDATHEATESPAREADENAGRRGFGRCHHRGGSNEGSESPGREGDENFGRTPSTPTPSQAPSGTPSV
jgi:hypothetical protein